MYGYGYQYGKIIGGGGGFDADAQAFITAAGITDPTQQEAINTLVVGMKADSVWTKTIALYPFVGGTATTHKFNLKDPRDLDAAYRITFNGGMTHSANGITPNGTNAYCETYVAGTNLTNNSTSWSIYSRTAQTADVIDIGGANGTGQGLFAYVKRSAPNGGFNSLLYESPDLDYSAMPASTGLIGASRQSSVSHRTNRNGVNLASSATANTFDITTMTTNIVLCAYRAVSGGSPIIFSSKNLAFAHLGTGLTDTDFANLYTLVQAYQTTLNRQL
tara:strand:- start:1035 stop:1859 length:825 start_codon:yes stop_codon:yes gene_type:complete